MAQTRTSTATKAFSRMDLLRIQVIAALRRANAPASMTERIRAGLANQWIATVQIYGVDVDEQGWCRLHLSIDWERHRLHIAAGRATVSVEQTWIDDTAIELDETLRLFEEYMASNPLQIRIRVTYPSGVDAATVDRELGFVAATPIPWAGRPQGVEFNVREVDELSLGIEMV